MLRSPADPNSIRRHLTAFYCLGKDKTTPCDNVDPDMASGAVEQTRFVQLTDLSPSNPATHETAPRVGVFAGLPYRYDPSKGVDDQSSCADHNSLPDFDAPNEKGECCHHILTNEFGQERPVTEPDAHTPIQAFECPRSEVSGRRLWGWVAQGWPEVDSFFCDVIAHGRHRHRFFAATHQACEFGDTGIRITGQSSVPTDFGIPFPIDQDQVGLVDIAPLGVFEGEYVALAVKGRPECIRGGRENIVATARGGNSNDVDPLGGGTRACDQYVSIAGVIDPQVADPHGFGSLAGELPSPIFVSRTRIPDGEGGDDSAGIDARAGDPR